MKKHLRAIHLEISPRRGLMKLLLACLGVLLSLPSGAQTRKPGSRMITGTVVSDSTLQPLSGASVRLSTRATGVVTDASGRFHLRVPDTCGLVASYLGYGTRELTAHRVSDGMMIRLTPMGQVLEPLTVYTGYQTLSGNQITGAYEKIDRKLLDREVSTDIVSRLEGKFTGLLFDHRNNDATFSIRGRSTIYGDASPLIILNDFPYEGDLKNINPNDVESITVLKDAAATSIWGTRAGNGVVVIRTRAASYNQPFRVEFSSNLTRISARDFDEIPFTNSADYIGVEEMLFDKGFFNGQINGYNHPALSPVVELLNQAKNGAVSETEATQKIDALKKYDIRKDFKKYLYQTGLNQQYFLTLSAGSQKLGYRLSGGYDNNTDVLDAAYQRIHVREENHWNPLPNLEVRTTLAYTSSEGKGGRPGFIQLRHLSGLYPYTRLADDQGNPLPVVRGHNSEFNQQAEDQGLLNWQYYPLTDYRGARPISRTKDLLLNASAKYHLTSAWSVNVNYQYELTHAPSHTLQTLQSYEQRDYINNFTQVNADGSLSYPLPKGDLLRWDRSELDAFAVRGQVNYDKTWGKSRLTGMAGMEMRQSHQTSLGGTFYGYDPSTLNYTSVDYFSYFPMYYASFIVGNIPDGSGSGDVIDRYVSYYTHGTYAYDGRYTLSMSARKDGSNIFGVSSNQRVVPLWSVGAAWILSKEPFYQSEWLPYLKVRLTDGFSGNVDNMLSAYTTIQMDPNATFTHAPNALIETPPNPDLRWEKVHEINVGIDFATKNNRVSGSLDYYTKKANDLLGDTPLDPTTGVMSQSGQASTPFVFRGNVADMKGYGINVALHSINLRHQFKWTTDVLFTYQRDKVTKYATALKANYEYISAGYGINPMPGKPLNAIFSYRWAGLDPQTGDPQGYLDGKVSKDYRGMRYDKNVSDLVYSGSALPPIFGTLRNTFSYKGLNLSFSLDCKFGDFFQRTSVSYAALFSGGTGDLDFQRRWQKPGDEKHTDVPSMLYPDPPGRGQFYSSSSILISPAGLIRFRTLDLSYELTPASCRWLPFNDLALSVSARNLGLLWVANKQGLDPEHETIRPFREVSMGLKFSF